MIRRKYRVDGEEPISAVAYCGNLMPAGVEAVLYATTEIVVMDLDSGSTLKRVVGHAEMQV